jgi:hypothetical protein
MGGHALKAHKTISLTDFTGCSYSDIKDHLQKYVDGHGSELAANTHDLIVIDIEGKFSPNRFGQYYEDGTLGEIIEAFKRRIRVVREILPCAKISLYGVIIPHGLANPDNPDFVKSVWGYREAGRLGLYDELDYVTPVLYMRWGPDDKKHQFGSIGAYTRMGVEYAACLTDRPLAPYLSLRVANRNSHHDDQPVRAEEAKGQLAYVRTHPCVDKIVYWTPPKRASKYYANPEEIQSFLEQINPCGR